LFIAVLAYGLWMGLDVDCGCFGPEDPEAEAFHALRLSFYRDLLMLTGVGFMYGWRRIAAKAGGLQSPLIAAWLAVACYGFTPGAF
jgi:hypothetical protein